MVIVFTQQVTKVARKADMCFFMLEGFVDINATETRTELETITTKAMSTVLGRHFGFLESSPYITFLVVCFFSYV